MENLCVLHVKNSNFTRFTVMSLMNGSGQPLGDFISACSPFKSPITDMHIAYGPSYLLLPSHYL
ncbi:hypothetical protein M407DRAFT_246350, partial [Tulasnella calospora MUT 4182]